MLTKRDFFESVTMTKREVPKWKCRQTLVVYLMLLGSSRLGSKHTLLLMMMMLMMLWNLVESSCFSEMSSHRLYEYFFCLFAVVFFKFPVKFVVAGLQMQAGQQVWGIVDPQQGPWSESTGTWPVQVDGWAGSSEVPVYQEAVGWCGKLSSTLCTRFIIFLIIFQGSTGYTFHQIPVIPGILGYQIPQDTGYCG